MILENFKAAIEAATGLSREALQIYAAIFVHILAALIMRRSLAHPAPWICALLVVAADEWLESGPGNRPVADSAVAMIIPTLLLLLTRFAPFVVRPARAP